MIRRKLLDGVIGHLNRKEITIVVGPRQAGKTTLLNMVMEYLKGKNRRSLSLNLDIESDRRAIATQEKLLNKVRMELGGNKGVIFIDEIQRKENAGLFLKGLYDMGLPYKFIVSGSGSVELKESVHESLAGRKRIFELMPLDLEEFINFRTGYRYIKYYEDFFSVEKEKANQLLDEYLLYGGYPRVVLENSASLKRATINEIFSSYIEKDIFYLLNVRKEEGFSDLVKLLADASGRIIKYSELANTLQISMKTVKEYIWYLQKTFIIRKVTPFFRDIKKEIRKAPLFYFTDPGLRNFAIDLSSLVPSDKGFLFQNLVYGLLRTQIAESAARIRYWRTRDGAEVDFVIDLTRELIPVEVKLTYPKISRSFAGFIARYRPKTAYIVSLSDDKEVLFEGARVHYLPYYKLFSRDII